MKSKRHLYFPTPVYINHAEEPDDLNARLLELIYAERDRDPKGTQRSNYRALKGWHSHIRLHKEPEYKPLLDELNQFLAEISTDSGYDPAYRLEVTSMWAIINEQGSSNRAHIHPQCVWSGVYYVQAPEDSGAIQFTDPRTVNIMNPLRYIPKKRRPRSRWIKVSFQPEAGKMVAFPAWLYHSVAPNLNTEPSPASDRVIISFNVSQRRIT